MKNILLVLFLGLFFVTCTRDEALNPLDSRLKNLLMRRAPGGDIQHFVLPDSEDYDRIPSDPKNPLSAEKVALGKMLFFETGLAQGALKEAGRGTYSCGSCHVPSAGFMPGRIQGIADGGVGFGYNGEQRTKFDSYQPEELDVQEVRPLSVLNTAFVTNTTWNGKFGAGNVNEGTEHLWSEKSGTEVNHLGLQGLEAQNIEGLKLHRMIVSRQVVQALGYKEMFDAAFPDFPEAERYSLMTASFAISAYLRALLTTEAPFQRWLRGEGEAMTEIEKRGAVLFYGKAGCYRCHKGPALSSMEFHALGVKDLYEEPGAFAADPEGERNFGRGGFTGNHEDMFKFKVPQIYNMGDSPFYFHGSSKRSLEELVEYFNNGIPENPRVPQENISPFFHPLNMTEAEMDDLVQFLENGLRDPNLDRYMPNQILSGNCFPNNDASSRNDLGCY